MTLLMISGRFISNSWSIPDIADVIIEVSIDDIILGLTVLGLDCKIGSLILSCNQSLDEKLRDPMWFSSMAGMTGT